MDYPLLLSLGGRRCVVVGGGPVGWRRAQALLAAGARVTVVAPDVVPDLAAAAAAAAGDGALTLHRRRYTSADLDGAWLVHAATDDPATNTAVAADAELVHVWCVRADDAARSAARTPAVARAGTVTVAVGGGGDPRRAVALRDAIALLLDTGGLPLAPRRPPAGGVGAVALVGGGPGDPELLTVAGRRLLAEADVVVVDKLAPRALLDTLPATVQVVDAGKAPHAHNMTQDEINACLVEHARAGRRVVRLKGGDPFVFGRGGEEMLACLAAGVAVQVVPGITSAVAVPALAGIPVTHRGVTQEFTVVSAHLDPAAAGTTVDYDALAAATGTLVFLMGVQRLGRIAEELIRRGRRPDTPVAVCESGTLAGQRVRTATLGTVATVAADAAPPAVIVVGDVVALRPALTAAPVPR